VAFIIIMVGAGLGLLIYFIKRGWQRRNAQAVRIEYYPLLFHKQLQIICFWRKCKS